MRYWNHLILLLIRCNIRVKACRMSASAVEEDDGSETADFGDISQMEMLLPADLLRSVTDGDLFEVEGDISKKPKLLELGEDEMPAVQCHNTTINDLPDEVLVHIFSYMLVAELALRIPLVCKRWQCVAEDSEAWRDKVYEPPVCPNIDSTVLVLQQAPKLHGIYVSGFFTSQALRGICEALNTYQRGLKKIKISVKVGTCEYVSEVLMGHKDSIEVLDICIFERFWDFDFELAQEYTRLFSSIGMCQNLRSLTLSGFAPSLFSIKGFVKIAHFCTQLHSLDITNYEDDSSDSLVFLLKRSVDSIRSLSISWAFLHPIEAFAPLAVSCQKLEKLCVVKPHGFQVAPCHIETLRSMVHLKDLSLPSIKTDVLRAFVDLFESGTFKNLEKLDLRYSSWVKNALLGCVVKECPKLVSLNLEHCHDLTSCGFESIRLLKRLSSLNLEGCSGLCDKVLPCIFSCDTLRYLNLSHIFSFSQLALADCQGKLRHLSVFLYSPPPH